jgi:hypothetical protein
MHTDTDGADKTVDLACRGALSENVIRNDLCNSTEAPSAFRTHLCLSVFIGGCFCPIKANNAMEPTGMCLGDGHERRCAGGASPSRYRPNR